MGTDIYLEWNEKSKADAEKQTEACFSIDGGNAGYLRASIHMLNENAALRLLFPQKYWHRTSKEEYDFRGSYAMLEQVAVKYLLCSITGNAMAVPEEQQANMAAIQKSSEAIARALKAMGQTETASWQICNGEIEGLADAVEWLNSLFKFFRLGIAKQEDGLSPYPYISW